MVLAYSACWNFGCSFYSFIQLLQFQCAALLHLQNSSMINVLHLPTAVAVWRLPRFGHSPGVKEIPGSSVSKCQSAYLLPRDKMEDFKDPVSLVSTVAAMGEATQTHTSRVFGHKLQPQNRKCCQPLRCVIER